MSNFNPSMIVPAAKSVEFAGAGENKRTVKMMLLEGITRQLELFKAPTADGRRWFQVGTKEVCITLRIGNQPLKLIGEETKVAVPVDHFEAAMGHFKGEVEKGRFDAQLAEAQKRMDARKDKMKATRAAKRKD